MVVQFLAPLVKTLNPKLPLLCQVSCVAALQWKFWLFYMTLMFSHNWLCYLIVKVLVQVFLYMLSIIEWQVVHRSVCQRDGRWFLKLLQAETDRMEGWCRQMELDQRENDLPEDSMSSLPWCFIVATATISLYKKIVLLKHFVSRHSNLQHKIMFGSIT